MPFLVIGLCRSFHLQALIKLTSTKFPRIKKKKKYKVSTAAFKVPWNMTCLTLRKAKMDSKLLILLCTCPPLTSGLFGYAFCIPGFNFVFKFSLHWLQTFFSLKQSKPLELL